jgi:RNA polymerase sigma-70 factor (ECF subfamily)
MDLKIARFARMRARQLAGSCGFSRDQEEDLFQEFALEHLRSMPYYDCQRSSPQTFGRRVIDNHVATMIQAKKAQCRDYRLCGSLDTNLRSAIRCSSISRGSDDTTLGPDVRSAIARLRPDLAHLCKLLLSDSITDAARIAGLSRATVYRRISEIRGVFRRAGLHNYLPSSG